MAFNKEWTEWHLTHEGWVMGDRKTTFSEIVSRPKPASTVLTMRYEEYQSHSLAKPKVYNHQVWIGDNEELISALKSKFPFPSGLE